MTQQHEFKPPRIGGGARRAHLVLSMLFFAAWSAVGPPPGPSARAEDSTAQPAPDQAVRAETGRPAGAASNSAQTPSMAFENAPGVLGTSIHTLRKEALKAYATESLGAVALGLEDIRLSPVNKNGLIALNLGEQIEFGFNSSAIPKKSRRLLDGIGRLLAENPDTQVQILTHTDDQGDSGYNRRLSQRRADAIKDYLISRGVAETRIAATGKGEDAPLVETDSRAPTRAERARNRRTELLIEPLEIPEEAQEPSENPETEPIDTLGASESEQPDDSADLP